jgi:ATP-binding cassette subfamily C protein
MDGQAANSERRIPGTDSLPAMHRLFVSGLMALGGLSLVCGVGVLSVPIFNMELFNRVMPTRDASTLLSMVVGLAICMAAYAIVTYLRNKALAVLSNRFVTQLSVPLIEVTAGSQAGPASGLQALRDLETLRGFLASPVCVAPFDLAWTPVLLCVFLFMHWAYFALALFCVLTMCAINLVADVATRRQLLVANDATARGMRTVASAVTSSEAVLAMGMLPDISARWDTDQAEMLSLSHRTMLRSKAVASAMRAVRLAMTAAMVALGLWLVLNGQAEPGSMVAGNMILAKLLMPLQQIANTRKGWVDALAAWRRIQFVLGETVPVRYSRPLPKPHGNLVAERLIHIPFGADRPVLRGVSFCIEPGEVLGIIGPAGAGKTTLMRLLLGMEAPTSGGVFLDGHSTHLWPREDFALHVGYVPQSVSLVDGTVAENIARMQVPDLGRVLEAARLAGVQDALAALPNGFSTRIKAQGPTLSAGQRQRIALARALYGQPRLLVLDEPNAFLDKAGEELLLALLRRLKAQGTGAVVVTHRPSLVQSADKLLVLRDGLVDQYGDRETVLRTLATPVVTIVKGKAGTP